MLGIALRSYYYPRLTGGRRALRIGLLTMIDDSGGSGESLRSFLKIGAGTLAHQQVALALACECTKIICISRGLTPELVSLQHEIERAGARFHCVNGPRGLAGLITAIDDVVVINDGLLAPQQEMRGRLGRGQSIIVQPAEAGIAAGFERVDAVHAAAGLMRIPGRLIEQLNQLPADCDVASALTRIALQAGVSKNELTAESGLVSSIKIIRNQNDADAIEADWFNQHLHGGAPSEQGIGLWLARRVVQIAGPSALHGKNGSNIFVMAALAFILLTLSAGWFGFATLALVCCALASLAGLTFGVMLTIEQESLALWEDSPTMANLLPWLLDAVLVVILSWNTTAPMLDAVFAPLMMLIVLRLVAKSCGAALASWLADRFLLCVTLAGLVAVGWQSQSVFAIAVGLGLFGIFWPVATSRITRV